MTTYLRVLAEQWHPRVHYGNPPMSCDYDDMVFCGNTYYADKPEDATCPVCIRRIRDGQDRA